MAAILLVLIVLLPVSSLLVRIPFLPGTAYIRLAWPWMSLTLAGLSVLLLGIHVVTSRRANVEIWLLTVAGLITAALYIK